MAIGANQVSISGIQIMKDSTHNHTSTIAIKKGGLKDEIEGIILKAVGEEIEQQEIRKNEAFLIYKRTHKELEIFNNS